MILQINPPISIFEHLIILIESQETPKYFSTFMVINLLVITTFSENLMRAMGLCPKHLCIYAYTQNLIQLHEIPGPLGPIHGQD